MPAPTNCRMSDEKMTHYRHRQSEAEEVTQPLREATGTILQTGVAVVGVGMGLAALGVGAGLASKL